MIFALNKLNKENNVTFIDEIAEKFDIPKEIGRFLPSVHSFSVLVFATCLPILVTWSEVLFGKMNKYGQKESYIVTCNNISMGLANG